MAFAYASYTEFTTVYSLTKISSAEITDHWLPHGALLVNEMLGKCFVIPFSSNNETAKDLNVHFAYLGILERTRNQTDSEELKKALEARIKNICGGNAPMSTSSGEAIWATLDTAFEAWSNTDTFKPTFDMRAPFNQRIDPDVLEQDWFDDGYC